LIPKRTWPRDLQPRVHFRRWVGPSPNFGIFPPHTRVNFSPPAERREISRENQTGDRALSPAGASRGQGSVASTHSKHDMSATLIGASLGFGMQLYINALRKLPLLRSECLRMPPRHPRSRFAWFRVCLTRADASARRRSRPDARVFARETCLLRKLPARASPPLSPPPSRPD